MVVNNSTFCSSPVFLEQVAIETGEKCDGFGDARKVFDEKTGVGETSLSDSSSDLLSSEATGHEGQSHEEESSLSSSSSTLMGWPLHRTAAEERNFDDQQLETQVSPVSGMSLFTSKFISSKIFEQTCNCGKIRSKRGILLNLMCCGVAETEMMKERFAKLLLGEDMSGCGNGVSTALAISNAITNLCGMPSLHKFSLLLYKALMLWSSNMNLQPLYSDNYGDYNL